MKIFSRSIPSSISAFRDSQRSHPRSQLLLNSELTQSHDHKPANGSTANNKPETISEDSVCDIDLATCIVGDLSNDIFSNIEKLNLNEKYKDNEDAVSADKKSENSSNVSRNQPVSLYIEDETAGATDGNAVKDLDADKDDKFETKINTDQERFKAEKSLLERRRVSLPEITTIPNLKAIRIK